MRQFQSSSHNKLRAANRAIDDLIKRSVMLEEARQHEDGSRQTQIAGHQAVLVFHRDWVCKRACSSELAFYRKAIESPSYWPFLCNVISLERDALVLQNVLSGLQAPSIIDLKPGLSRTESLFPVEKNERMRLKEQLSGCRRNGFRVSGFLLRDERGRIIQQTKIKTEDQRRSFSDPSTLRQLFRQFFSQESRLRADWIKQTLEFLSQFQSFLRMDNEHRFRGTSLLMVTDQSSCSLRIKWIDFTYSWHEGRGFFQSNLIRGVVMLSDFIKSLIEGEASSLLL